MKARARYTVDLERDEAGTWVARVRGVPGCHTQGRTIEQVRARIREALSLFIGDAAERVTLADSIKLSASARRSIERHRTARKRLDAETERAQAATRAAVEALTSAGLSLADAGELLGLSRQRVHQVRHRTR